MSPCSTCAFTVTKKFVLVKLNCKSQNEWCRKCEKNGEWCRPTLSSDILSWNRKSGNETWFLITDIHKLCADVFSIRVCINENKNKHLTQMTLTHKHNKSARLEELICKEIQVGQLQNLQRIVLRSSELLSIYKVFHLSSHLRI